MRKLTVGPKGKKSYRKRAKVKASLLTGLQCPTTNIPEKVATYVIEANEIFQN